MLSQLILLSDRLAQHLSLPQSATPPPSPAAITILLAACQSMQSRFLQSPSMPPRSQNSPLSPSSFTAVLMGLLLQHQQATRVCMTAPHTECSSMATALLPYMPTARDQSVLSMQSPSLLTLYYRNTRMKILCEHSKPGLVKRVFGVKLCVGTTATCGATSGWTVSWTVLSRMH